MSTKSKITGLSRRAIFRIFIICSGLMCLQACSSKVAYNNIDWWIHWYVDDYIEFNEEQENTFDKYLAQWLDWHKQNELALYEAQLKEINTEIDERSLDFNRIIDHFERAKSHWERVQTHISPDLAKLASTLNNEQIVAFFAALEKENKKNQEELNEQQAKPLAEQLKNRREKIEENIEKRVGNLNAEQKQIIATYVEQYIPTKKLWVAYQRNIQSAARKLFAGRAFNANFEQDLVAIMTNPDQFKSAQYIQASKHNMKLTATMIAELLTTLSNKQRGKLKQSVDELIETVASIQQ